MPVGIRIAACLVALLWLGGCAATAGPEEAAEPSRLPRPADVPADASPEFDFLAARQLELEGEVADALEFYGRALHKDPESAYLHRRYAELAARQGLIEPALEHARRAYALAPDDPDVRTFLATLHRVRRDVPAAEAVLLEEDGRPFAPDAGALLFSIYLESGRNQRAVEVAQWLVEREPDALRGYFALAEAYERMDRHDEVEDVLRQALAREPGNVAVYGALARLYRSKEDPDGEIAIYREVLDRHPDHHATLVALSEAQLRAEDEEAARETLLRIERLHPDDLRAVIRLALLDFEARHYAEAAERFERAFRSNPEQHELAYFLGLVYQRADDTERSLEFYAQVPPGHERYAQAMTQSAAIHERQGDYQAALEVLEGARRAHPSRPLDLYYASLRAKAGEFDGAVRFMLDLLSEEPEDDELLYNLGVLYGERKLYEEAVRYMQRAVEKNPENASALNYIGYTWAEQGRNLDEAEKLIERARELRPDDGFITDSLAWVYYMRARPLMERGDAERGRALLERALRELERAVELTGGDPVISEHLGDVYLLLDDREQALEHFEEALQLEPREGEQPDLHEKLERLRDELGR